MNGTEIEGERKLLEKCQVFNFLDKIMSMIMEAI